MSNTSSFIEIAVKLLRTKTFQVGSAIGLLLFCFQNCGQPGQINLTNQPLAATATAPSAATGAGDLTICQGISCTLNPLTKKVAVTTLLLALGDETNHQLVINGGSSQLIAETVVRYTTPVQNPKILVIRDHKTEGESPEDTVYVSEVLLARYKPTFLIEPDAGITLKDIEDYDLVWFNNPGYPMSTKRSYEALMSFKGGIVLQGDDMSQGVGFSMEPLTHLRNIDNGAWVTCEDGKTYPHDNNSGNQYRVNLDASKMPSSSTSQFQFRYGNDIDLTSTTSSEVEVLAVAYGGPSSCVKARPTIVRYFKN